MQSGDTMTLTLDNVCKSYGDKQVLHNVSFEMKNGVYGLLGSNGAGKTTLLNIIVRLLANYSGTVYCDGKDISEMSDDYFSRIGYLPQYPQMYKNFTAAEFLEYMALLKCIPKKAGRSQISELLDTVNLTDCADKKIGAFSGGMRQRLGIAQAMLGNPEMIILDEPTAGLDPRERIRFRNILSALSSDKIVLIATHIVPDIENIAKEVIIMSDGRVITKGAHQTLTAPLNSLVHEAVVGASELESIMQRYTVSNIASCDGGYKVRVIGDTYPDNSVQASNQTLEDAFLYYTGDKAR